MEWLNLHTSTLDSAEFIGAAPVERSTWLCLQRYCIGQENGGKIIGAASWGDRKWQQLARVTLREVKMPSDLWRWNNNDLELNFYPIGKQREIEAKRQAGKDTVAKRWNKQDSSGSCSADSSAICSADTEGEGNRKEKGIRKEVGQNDPAAIAAPTSAELPLSDEAKETKQEKQTDVEWLASLACDTDAYAGIDVPREHAKCARWCIEHKKQLTRRRFVNWLNRCEKPMQGDGGALMR